MNRPVTTLFMLMSVEGKISTGATDDLDVDKDFPQIAGLREGLPQYYEIEQTTDLWSLNSGRVQAKIGVNTKETPNKTPVSFVIIDNRHLDRQGIRYLSALAKELVLVTTNRQHPAFQMEEEYRAAGPRTASSSGRSCSTTWISLSPRSLSGARTPPPSSTATPCGRRASCPSWGS